MKAVVTIVNFIGTLCAISGIVLYITVGGDWVIYMGAASLLASIINVLFGNQNSLITEIITVFIALIVCAIWKLDYLHVIALALCIGDVGALVIGWAILGIVLLISLIQGKDEQRSGKAKAKLQRNENAEPLSETLREPVVLIAVVVAVIAMIGMVVGTLSKLL